MGCCCSKEKSETPSKATEKKRKAVERSSETTPSHSSLRPQPHQQPLAHSLSETLADAGPVMPEL